MTTEQNAPTRASVGAPPSRSNSSFLAEASIGEEVEAADNMKKSAKAKGLVGMTFNMPKHWHTRFKLTATARGIKMNELLLECFAAYEREQRQKAAVSE